MIKFTVFGNPKTLMRHRDRKPVNKNRKWFTPKYDPSAGDKADFLAKAMEFKPDVPITAPIALSMKMIFKRPQNHYRTGKYSGELKPNATKYYTSTPDYDNVAKFVGDALNGIFWLDDKFIVIGNQKKYYGESPRIEIEIEELE